LRWLVSEVKGGLRDAVEAELRHRGIPTPPRQPYQPPRCREHPSAELRAEWYTDTIGRQHIKGRCVACNHFLGFLPVDRYAELANAAEVAP
jgi:hypothetical protein